MNNLTKTGLNVVALVLLIPSIAFADGGGPLLLIVNFLVFLYGSVLIILVEWFMYVRLAAVPRNLAFWDSVVANLLSTIVIGFAFPFIIGLIGYMGLFLPKGWGDVLLAVGTWVFEGIKYPKLTFTMTAVWLAVTFFLTVWYEGKILRWRWERRGFEGKIKPLKLSWYCNGVTYAGLIIFLLAYWILDKKGI